jgi:hypothetical protein
MWGFHMLKPEEYFEASLGACFIFQFMLMISISRTFRCSAQDRSLQVRSSYFVYTIIVYALYAIIGILLLSFPSSIFLQYTWTGVVIPTTPVTILYFLIDGRYIDRTYVMYIMGRQTIITVIIGLWIALGIHGTLTISALTPYLLISLSSSSVQAFSAAYNYINQVTKYSIIRLVVVMVLLRLLQVALYVVAVIHYYEYVDELLLLITGTVLLSVYDLIGEIKTALAYNQTPHIQY